MPNLGIPGMPGMGDVQTSYWRRVLRSGAYGYLGQGRVIDNTITRDPTNTGFETQLQAGLMLGKSTANSLKYGASVIGLTSVALGAADTSLTVPVSVAKELARRIQLVGGTTFKLTGPPAAGGVVATVVVTFIGINTVTGVITIGATGVAMIAGSLVQPTDGTETILTFLVDGFPMEMSDNQGNATDIEDPKIAIEGEIEGSQLLNWPSDTSLQTYIMTALSQVPGGGKFVFTGVYG
jgi:hypothetical protein